MEPHPEPPSVIIRRTQLPAVIGVSQSTLDRLRLSGDFPKPRLVGLQALGWLRSEIETWLLARPRAAH